MKVILLTGGIENYYFDIPGLVQYLQFTSGNWKYETQPSETGKYCTGLTGKTCKWPHGKTVGGSSALNYMVVTRGTPEDYDEWANLGNTGWSYEEIFPYFKKIENFQIFADYINQSDHGYNGPVTVSYTRGESKIAKLIIEATQQYGFDYIDYNGEKQVKKLQNL